MIGGVIGSHYRKTLNLLSTLSYKPINYAERTENGLQEPRDISKRFIMQFECFVQFLNDTGKRFNNLQRRKVKLKDLTLQFDKAKPRTAKELKAI